MKKCNSQKGFTLSEVMISMLIILMVTAIVAQGIPLAQRAYVKVVDSANAQVLLSNTTTVLLDELGTASKVETATGSVTYASGKTGAPKTLNAKTDIGASGVGLVSNGLSEKQHMEIKFDSVTFDGEMVTFGKLEVTKDGYSEPLAQLDEYKVAVINGG